jgi:transmembrane sensor
MNPTNDSDRRAAEEIEEEAIRIFLRRQGSDWTARDLIELESWLTDPAHERAFKQVTEAWKTLGHAAAAPEVIALRKDALESVGLTGARRHPILKAVARWQWAAAAIVVIVVGLSASFLENDANDVIETAYETDVGEQREVELEDRSRITLDALTKVKVRMARDSRVVELIQGQAHFSVSSDPKRPFRVAAGDHAITAVGTSFNVEYLENQIVVAMIEGKVAVSLGAPAENGDPESARRIPPKRAGRTIDLVAGQSLRVMSDGQLDLIPDADISAAIAWRKGMLILADTRLGDAILELNRHSRLQIRISDPAVASLLVSGVFESGDAEAFLETIQSILPVSASQIGPDLVLLSATQADQQ